MVDDIWLFGDLIFVVEWFGVVDVVLIMMGLYLYCFDELEMLVNCVLLVLFWIEIVVECVDGYCVLMLLYFFIEDDEVIYVDIELLLLG